MALPKALDHCPKDPGCVAKKVFQDTEDNTLYTLTVKGFVPHTCNTRASELIHTVFTGMWKNKKTERIRYIGPERLERSALKAPGGNAEGGAEVWKFIGLLKGSVTWTEAEVSEAYREDIKAFK